MTSAETKALIIDFKNTFSSEEGKRVLANLSRLCCENDTTYIDGNSYGTAFNEGKRRVILYIRWLLNADPSTVKLTGKET